MKLHEVVLGGLLVGGLLLPGMARADDQGQPAGPGVFPGEMPAPAPMAAPGREVPSVPAPFKPMSGFGAFVSAGGGGTAFTGEGARSYAAAGGTWDVRLSLGTREYAGVEVAYVGAAQDIAALGLDTNAVLVRNGIESVLRANLPISMAGSDWLIEPFVFGGAGWSRYDIVNQSFNTSDVHNSDDVLVIPFGGGFGAGYRGLMFEGRFTFRSVYNNELFGQDVSLNNWTVGGNIGYEF